MTFSSPSSAPYRKPRVARSTFRARLSNLRMEGRQSVPTCLPRSYPLAAVFNPCGLWLHRFEALDPFLDRRGGVGEPIQEGRGIPGRGGAVERSGRLFAG